MNTRPPESPADFPPGMTVYIEADGEAVKTWGGHALTVEGYYPDEPSAKAAIASAPTTRSYTVVNKYAQPQMIEQIRRSGYEAAFSHREQTNRYQARSTGFPTAFHEAEMHDAWQGGFELGQAHRRELQTLFPELALLGAVEQGFARTYFKDLDTIPDTRPLKEGDPVVVRIGAALGGTALYRCVIDRVGAEFTASEPSRIVQVRSVAPQPVFTGTFKASQVLVDAPLEAARILGRGHIALSADERDTASVENSFVESSVPARRLRLF